VLQNIEKYCLEGSNNQERELLILEPLY